MSRVLGVVVLAWCGCKDLAIPPPPGPGTVSGRVVVSIPGVPARQAVGGATVELVSSSLATTASADGRFTLSGITVSSGTVLFRAQVPGLGLRQKTLSLESIGAGVGQNVPLGDVFIVESAVVRGRARRSDLIHSPTGHLNSVIFVPEGPYTAYTADDGAFVLAELPEGPLQLSVFRSGYQSAGLDIQPRGGEVLTVRDLVLEPLSSPEMPGQLRGTLAFVPEQPDLGDVAVRGLRVGGGEALATLDSARSEFSFATLAPGLYDVVATRSGFRTAAMRNVLVASAADRTVGTIMLVQGASVPFDGGERPQPFDAGAPTDAGADGGTDGGLDAGPPPCVGPGDCRGTEWCDLGVCRPQCATSAMCTNARVCDTMTGTCVTPCASGCASTETCDPVSNSCRRLCDLSVPCPSGQRCNPQSFCVPECLVTGDCNSPYRVCQAGACVSNGMCLRDRDCPSAMQFCIGGLCATQTRVFVDGGSGPDAGPSGFACNTPCACREGEACETSGVCVSEPVPTVYLQADGGGSGTLPSTPASALQPLLATAPPGATFALRADDTFAVPSATAIPSNGVTLAGGYVSCGSARWVRDVTKYSTVRSALPPVLSIAGTSAAPRTDVKLANLDLRTDDNSASSCNRSNFEASSTLRLKLNRLRGHVGGTTTCSGAYGLGSCFSCADIDFDTLEQLPQTPAFIQYSLFGLQLGSVSGRLKTFVMPPTAQGSSLGLVVGGLVGPLVLDDIRVPPAIVGYASIGVQFASCGTHRFTLRNSRLSFPMGPGPSGQGYGSAIAGSNCGDAHVVDNLIDGSLQGGLLTASGRGVWFTDVSGELSRNRVLLPTVNGTAGGGFEVIRVQGQAQLDVFDNQVSGGTFFIPSILGVRLLALSDLTRGPVHVERNQLSAGPASALSNGVIESAGVWVNNVPGTVGVMLRDNVISAPAGAQVPGPGASAACHASYGMHFVQATALAERNRVTASAGHRTNGVRMQNASTVELVGNALYAGIDRSPRIDSCSGVLTPANTSAGVHVEGAATQLFALGNTIEGVGEPGQATPSVGVFCSGPVVAVMNSNVINGGRSATAHWMLGKEGAGSSACETPTGWTNNYFFYENPGPRSSGELVGNVVLADAGVSVPDTNGNIVGDRNSCLDPGSTQRYHLLPAGPCVDRGDVGRRRDNSVPTLDIDRNARVQGARADIGCSEEQ